VVCETGGLGLEIMAIDRSLLRGRAPTSGHGRAELGIPPTVGNGGTPIRGLHRKLSNREQDDIGTYCFPCFLVSGGRVSSLPGCDVDPFGSGTRRRLKLMPLLVSVGCHKTVERKMGGISSSP